MRIVIFLVITGSFLGGCSYLNKKVGLKDDNFIEEGIERQIESRTGLDIDLSPNSVEED